MIALEASRPHQKCYHPGTGFATQSCGAATNITIEFGDELGAVKNGHGAKWMQFESIYVR